MPEIWLNYGSTEIVLDIRAENLNQKVDSDGKVMDDDTITERLKSINLTKPMELVVLHNSKSIQKIITSLFTICEQKSLPFPKILSDKKIANQIREGLPEGSTVSEFDDAEINPELVFVGEVEFDGLFGYETISTRLLKRFGQESMLAAYAKRKSNSPAPGQPTESFAEATKFVNNFDIQAIEIVAGSSGMVDFAVGHPSHTCSLTKSLEASAVKDIDEQKSMIISTGKDSSNRSLAKSLSSLWNCTTPIKKDGLAILAAECQDGLGSEAIQQYVEGRMSPDRLKNPTKYIDGMENILYLHESRPDFQVGIISTLPELYAKKLGMIPLSGIKQAVEYILKTQGPRQKISIVTDGARLLLR